MHSAGSDAGSPISIVDRIHARALGLATRYRQTEAELIDVFQQVEEHRVFLKRGHSSLFDYVTKELGLGENVAYTLIGVARKSREVPELKTEIAVGAITLSNARRIVPVLTAQNKEEWIEKAKVLSNRKLEKEIVRVYPKAGTPETTSYVAADRVKLSLGLSEREMLKLRRVQDLLSQSRRRAISLEETIEVLTAEYLGRHDPVAKAKRHVVKKGANGSGNVESAAVGIRAEVGTKAQDLETTRPKPEPEATRAEPEPETTRAEPETEVTRVEPETSFRPAQKRGTVLVGKRVTLRVPIPRSIQHRVNLRDERRCTQILPDGARCNQARWIEIHHRVPVSEGGGNTLDNLTTLCSAHHRYEHSCAG